MKTNSKAVKDPFFNVIDFEGLEIKLASPEMILDWSYGEVTKPETINYRTWRPEKDGLFCEKIFGPTKDWECYCGKYKKIRYRGVTCDKCGVEVTHSRVRRERMGHITLAAPVVHLWFLKNNPSPLTVLLGISQKDIDGVVYFNRHLVTSIDKSKRKEAIEIVKESVKGKKEELKDRFEKEMADLESLVEKEKDQLQKKIKNQEQLNIAYQEIDVRVKQKKQRLKNKKLLEQERLIELGTVLEDKVRTLDVLTVLSEAEYLNLNQLGADKFFKVEMGAEALTAVLESLDMKTMLRKAKKDLKKTSSVQKQRKLMKIVRLLNGALKSDIDPKWMIMRVLPVIPPELRPMVQLTGGRFATSDLNDLYRRVLNRNNRLKRLVELGAPKIILRNEKRMLQEAVDNLIDASKSSNKRRSTGRRVPRSLSDLLRGKKGRFRRNLLGKRVDYSGRSAIVVGPELKLNQCGLPKEMALEMFKPFILRETMLRGLAPNIRSAKSFVEHRPPEVYDILEEVIEGKLVLLNRAPTLHKLGMQAFAPILIDGLAIRVHPCVCSGFNADFDGDQMGVHIPLSEKSQEEAHQLMVPSRNLLKPSDASPVSIPSKDMIVGCYFITSIREEDIAKNESNFNSLNWFGDSNEAIRAYEQGLVGLRWLIGVRIDGVKMTTTVGRLILNSILPKGVPFVNEVVGNQKVKQMINYAFDNLSEDVSAELIDALKDIGFWASTLSGISLSISDCRSFAGKSKLIEEANQKAGEVEENYHQGLITAGEKRRLTQDIWLETTEQIADLTWGELEEDSPIKIFDKAGIKRVSRDQIKQISGMRGLVVNPLGEIVPLPTKSNFREGLSAFEYVTGARGSRKGLTDTALKTADAGYLTRRLVDASHRCLIREDDCKTKGKLVIENKGARASVFPKRILGRILAEKVIDPKTGKELLAKGAIVDDAAVALIIDKRVASVAVRSPLVCQTKHGVCSQCYGWDLSTRQMVKIGLPVGVVAAQSVGEPGTQLTMRTKHVGGVVGLDVTQGLPRIQELLEVRMPKVPAPLAEIDGRIKVKELDDGYRLTITSTDKDHPEVINYSIPLASSLQVKDGDLIAKGDRLASGSLDLQEVLKVRGVEAVQLYLLEEVQKVYESQGIGIHDKHFEIIIREMSRKIRIETAGDSYFLVGEFAEESIFEKENAKIAKKGGRQARGKRVVLGLIGSALHTDSWLSAASFQETTNILTEAAFLGKVDHLLGLKENVIIGRLIPTDPVRAKIKNGH
ncbi:MAG: DNA-directed RNA polymerase subunit beta' [Patescibacteria group bacterium]